MVIAVYFSQLHSPSGPRIALLSYLRTIYGSRRGILPSGPTRKFPRGKRRICMAHMGISHVSTERPEDKQLASSMMVTWGGTPKTG